VSLKLYDDATSQPIPDGARYYRLDIEPGEIHTHHTTPATRRDYTNINDATAEMNTWPDPHATITLTICHNTPTSQ